MPIQAEKGKEDEGGPASNSSSWPKGGCGFPRRGRGGGANSYPGAVAARAEPRPVPPARQQRLPTGRSLSLSCRSSSLPSFSWGRTGEVGRARPLGRRRLQMVRRISFLRERWRLAKSVPSLGTRQEREATLLTQFN